MGSVERKLARQQQREIKKVEKKLVKQLSKFGSLPDNCLTCQKEYDKNNKEQGKQICEKHPLTLWIDFII